MAVVHFESLLLEVIAFRLNFARGCASIRSMLGADLDSTVTVSGIWSFGILRAFGNLGMDVEAICERASVSYELVSDVSARFPRDTMGQLWRAAVEISGDPCLGLRAAEQMPLRPTGLLSALVLNCRTVGDGFVIGARYTAILAQGQIPIVEETERGHRVRMTKVEGALPITPNEVEFATVVIRRFADIGTAGAFRPEEMHFDHPSRGSIAEYERVFGCPVLFGKPHTCMLVSDEMWSLELPGDPGLLHELEGVAKELQERLQTPGFTQAVSQQIRILLPTGRQELNTVADALHVSERTLQRRLHKEGTNYRAVLDATRRAVVHDGITRHQTPKELARQAGFPSVYALNQAIRRWNSEE